MSEVAEDAPPAEVTYPPDVQALMDAAVLYAKARVKLPPPGREFDPTDTRNFQNYTVALLAFERAGMAFAGRRVSQ